MSESSLGVPCDSSVQVTVIAPARHLCPFKDEVDVGTVRLEWTTSRGATVELHALAALIATQMTARISHEQWTADLAEAVSARTEIADLMVTSRWRTAGIEVVVRSFGDSASTLTSGQTDG
jgi:NADPH-dependent 7-cyano-7-deazaguanine reductase QueF